MLLAQLTLGTVLALAGPLTVTLTPATLTGNPGDTLIFTGTFSNESSDPIYINDFSINGPFAAIGSDFTVSGLYDQNSWLANGIPLAGNTTSGTVSLFSVLIPVDFDFQNVGPFEGSFSALNGTEPSSGGDLPYASAAFSVSVSDSQVPEPGSVCLILTGLATGCVIRRQRVRVVVYPDR